MLTCMLLDYPLEFNSKEEEMFQKTLKFTKNSPFFNAVFVLGKIRIETKT